MRLPIWNIRKTRDWWLGYVSKKSHDDSVHEGHKECNETDILE